MRSQLVGAAWLFLGLSGCQTSSDGKLFDVTATLKSSTCGAAVPTESTQQFQIRIVEGDSAVTWENLDSGEMIEGTVSNDKFTLAKIATYQFTSASEGESGCSVRRHDSYSGTFARSGSTVTKFTADVDSNYAEAAGYGCDASIGTSGGFADLPCDVDYTLTASAHQ